MAKTGETIDRLRLQEVRELAEAAGPLAGESRVNSFTDGVQTNPAVAVLKDGSYVVAWTSVGQDGSGEGVYGQHFAANGSPIGAEFRIPTTTADDQRTPALAALSDGGFVATWQGRVSGADGHDVYAQRYDAAGNAQGGQFIVNGTTASFQGSASVAGLPGGGFLVTWHSLGSNETSDIYARRFNADGSPAAGEFRVNSFTTGNQDEASVAILAGGGFVVAWQSEGQDGSGRGVYGQVYNEAGAAVGGEFRANTTTAGSQQSPAVAALEGGGFVITWSGNATRGQVYAADGTPVGGEIVIATGFNGVSVTAMQGGGFAVSWDELSSGGSGDGAGFGVVARAFTATGGALGEIIVVNQTTAGDQRTGGAGSLGQLADGSIVFAWAGAGTGDSSGVFQRRFELSDEAGGPAPIVGTPGDDTLPGTSGDDVIRGMGGNDDIDGKDGTDIAEYRGARSDYRVTVRDGVYTVDDQREGSPDGSDSLRNVEQLRFSGGNPIAIADAVAPADPSGIDPLTGAILVNTMPDPSAITPMTVALAGGGYAIVWLGDFAVQGHPATLRGRVFDAAGQPVGDQFTVGEMDFLSEEQVPSLTALAGGGFAVAWMGPSPDIFDQYQDLQIQIYDAAGATAGPRINAGSTGRFGTPVLVGTADGGFLLLRDPENGTDEFSTTGQFFNSGGTAVGSAFPVAADVGDHLSAAILANGDIVMAWNEPPQSNGERAFVRLFSPTGQPRGGAFVVDAAQSAGHNVPSVAALAGGGFVMTWFHSNPDTDVYARIFDSAGNPVSATFTVNENTAGKQWYGYVEALDDGGFAVSWTGADGDFDGVFARAFDASGQPRGGETRINPDVAGNQEGEIRHLAQLANGDLIFSWTGDGAENVDGVFTRLYALVDESGPPPIVGSSDGDEIAGTSGDDSLRGLGGNDDLRSGSGGDDRLRGDDGNDSLYFGATLNEADIADGGPGTDTLAIQGDYADLRLAGVSGVETLLLLSGSDTRFGDVAGDRYDYAVSSTDANVEAGQILTIVATGLLATESLTFDGSAETNGHFRIFAGAGVDDLTGGSGDDGFFFGSDGNLTGADRVDGGPGTDTLALRGNYVGSGAIVFENASFSGIEVLALLSGHSNEYSGQIVAGGFDYDVATADGNVAAGQRLDVNAARLGADESLRFDGRAEGDGSFRILSGAGGDSLWGGAGDDLIYGGLGKDALDGQAGADTFLYRSAAESTSTAYDSITGFDWRADRIDAPGGARAFDHSGSGALSTASFDSDLASGLAGLLGAGQAALFTATSGSLAGHVFAIIDLDGVDGYLAGGDLVIELIDPVLPIDPGAGVIV